ncbi:hypothetical protein [Algoriphagus limi]|uniref:Outer membrane protein beta-barrel domain-containing protein n=1 Tax=Algoriphagus limi TaxID=2975273 RepID=A0ABT2G5V0_9BACT|nr:hypothetical protein [Algoriphagus limi]MCS5489846.1 hypothetical protein [Algoriphagus limi]
MQEDKLAQEIANSLKKHQEESFHPYEIGAWEAFDKKRKGGVLPWWKLISAGIAASLVIGMAWWWFGNADMSKFELANTLSEKNQSGSISSETQATEGRRTESDMSLSIQEFSETDKSSQRNQMTDLGVTNENEFDQETNTIDRADSKVTSNGDENFVFLAETRVEDFSNIEQRILDVLEFEVEKPSLDQFHLAFSPKAPETEFPKYAFNNYPVIKTSDKDSKLGWEVGLSPAFGGSSTSQNTEVTSNSLGLGMAMAMEVSDKLQIGTGLAINSLNQQSQFSSSPGNMFASSIAPSQDKITLSQAQLELPIFVQYPLNRSRSVSLRAGFSNIYSFNQEVDLESTVNRQVVVSGNGINSAVVRQESVVQKTSLESSNQRFYPFATFNLGLNLRVFQNEQVNYVFMPFYNLPMTDFSGFVENPGMVGATFKVNFMSGKK